MLPTRRIQPVAVSGWTYLTRPHVGCHLHGLHSSMIRTAAAADRTVPAATVVSERPAFRTITATPVEKVVRNNRTLDPREAEVTPSTLIRKTIADNGNEYTTPNSIYREVKKLGDVFRSKRHFKRVLGPMRRSNQVCFETNISVSAC